MRITYSVKRVAHVLIQEPDAWHWGYNLTEKSSIVSGVIYPILNRMTENGWLVKKKETNEDKDKGRPLRTYYKVTKLGLNEMKKVTENWKR